MGINLSLKNNSRDHLHKLADQIFIQYTPSENGKVLLTLSGAKEKRSRGSVRRLTCSSPSFAGK